MNEKEQLINLLASLDETERKELDRKVRVSLYINKQTEHKCTPQHYCSEHKVDLCGECYITHYRTQHNKSSLHFLEKMYDKSTLTLPQSKIREESLSKSKTEIKSEAKVKHVKDKFKDRISALSLEELQKFFNELKDSAKI